MITKKIRSDIESRLAPSLDVNSYLRAIYPSAISDNPINKTTHTNSHSTSNVSNNMNDKTILEIDIAFGINLFIGKTFLFRSFYD